MLSSSLGHALLGAEMGLVVSEGITNQHREVYIFWMAQILRCIRVRRHETNTKYIPSHFFSNS